MPENESEGITRSDKNQPLWYENRNEIFHALLLAGRNNAFLRQTRNPRRKLREEGEFKIQLSYLWSLLMPKVKKYLVKHGKSEFKELLALDDPDFLLDTPVRKTFRFFDLMRMFIEDPLGITQTEQSRFDYSSGRQVGEGINDEV